MDENLYRKWDTTLKYIGIFGAIISFTWGIIQYYDKISRDRSFSEELFKRRVSEYHLIANTAGYLSTPSSNINDFNAHINDFERLYWASLATLNSNSVIEAMDYLRKGISNYQRGETMLGQNSPEDQLKIRVRMLCKEIKKAIDSERKELSKYNLK